MTIRLLILAVAVLALAVPGASGKPTRIVSTNVCADQLALAIADRDRVISVSRMAIEPQISNFAEAARGAGVSPAAPYRHFRDRDELLASVALQGFAVDAASALAVANALVLELW